MTSIDRRGLIGRLAFAAPLAATAACHPIPTRGLRFVEPGESGADVDLSAIEAEFEAAWAVEAALFRDLPLGHSEEEWDQCSRAQDRTAVIADRIAVLPARDLRVLRLKAHALVWAEGAENGQADVAKLFAPEHRNTRLMGQIVRGLITMTVAA